MLSISPIAPLAGLVACCPAAFAAGPFVNAQLPYHVAKLDAQSKLQAWYEPDRNLGWDHVLHLGWDFLEHKVPLDQRYGTGLKVSLLNSVFDGKTLQADYWQHNPAMTFAGLVDGVVAWYPYSGDTASVAVVREMLDQQLTHGTAPDDWDWAGVPYATSCSNTKDYGSCIQNMPKEFYGALKPTRLASWAPATRSFINSPATANIWTPPFAVPKLSRSMSALVTRNTRSGLSASTPALASPWRGRNSAATSSVPCGSSTN